MVNYPVFLKNIVVDMGSLQYAPWRAITGYLVKAPRAEDKPYRPEQWKKVEPQTYLIDDGDELYFDAAIRIEHTNSRRITEHPVQVGANITDHSYQLPARVILEIGMSDVMDDYKKGQWIGEGYSKSRNAYEKLRQIQKLGRPVNIVTRLEFYENMVIENIVVRDDVSTKYGLIALITLRQIITAWIIKQKLSSDPQVTHETDESVKISEPIKDPGEKSVLYEAIEGMTR